MWPREVRRDATWRYLARHEAVRYIWQLWAAIDDSVPTGTVTRLEETDDLTRGTDGNGEVGMPSGAKGWAACHVPPGHATCHQGTPRVTKGHATCH